MYEGAKQGQALGQLAGLGGPYNQIQAQALMPGAPVPPTLIGAISRSDELAKRLAGLNAEITQIAQQIGGPWPAADDGGKPPSTAPSAAMALLNENINDAHVWVSRIEQSIGAIRRSLGG